MRIRTPDSPAVYDADLLTQAEVFLDYHRDRLAACLDGLTEEEARWRGVPSKTTLLGLVKHATFVERVWFGEAATGASRRELGIADSPDASFDLTDADTIASVRGGFADAVAASHRAVDGLTDADVFRGNRRGPLPLRWIYLHMIEELAQHNGHAEILREQVLARRGDPDDA